MFLDVLTKLPYVRNDKISAILFENDDKIAINKVTSAITLKENHRSLRVNTTLTPTHDGAFSTY